MSPVNVKKIIGRVFACGPGLDPGAKDPPGRSRRQRVLGGGDGARQPLLRETGDVVEFPEILCLRQVLEEDRWRSDKDLRLGKPLQHVHREGITEQPIQFIPIIQQRPLVASFVVLRAPSWIPFCPSWIIPHPENRCCLPPERSAV